MKKYSLIALLIGIFIFPISLVAQSEPEEVAAIDDDFQNNYYEALKQKGIENYDRAIESLQKCLKIQPENPVLFFEIGKNYLFQQYKAVCFNCIYFGILLALLFAVLQQWFLIALIPTLLLFNFPKKSSGVSSFLKSTLNFLK